MCRKHKHTHTHRQWKKGTREPSYTVGGNINWYNRYAEQYWSSLKTKNRTTISSNNPTPGHVSGENHNLKRYMHPTVHCSAIYNSQDMEATWMAINRGMDKPGVVHIYNGKHSAMKKNKIYLQNKNRLTDLENQLTVTKEKTQSGRDKLGIWD